MVSTNTTRGTKKAEDRLNDMIYGIFYARFLLQRGKLFFVAISEDIFPLD